MIMLKCLTNIITNIIYFSCRAEQYDGQSGEADIFINVEEKLKDFVTVLPFHAARDLNKLTASATRWSFHYHAFLVLPILTLM